MKLLIQDQFEITHFFGVPELSVSYHHIHQVPRFISPGEYYTRSLIFLDTETFGLHHPALSTLDLEGLPLFAPAQTADIISIAIVTHTISVQ